MFTKHALAALALTVGLSASGAVAGEYRKSDVDAAVKALGSQDQVARKTAAFKLTEMGAVAVSAVPTLITIVQSDESMSVRGEASKALGNIGPAAESAVPALIAFLQSSDGGYERTYAASALGDIGKQPDAAVPVLIKAVQEDQEPVVRQLAARALGGFGAQGSLAIPALVAAIKSGDKEMRAAAAAGLENIPARADDVTVLVELLGDEIDSARIAAAKSLGGLGPQAMAAVPALQNLKADSNDDVKSAAAAALRRIKK